MFHWNHLGCDSQLVQNDGSVTNEREIRQENTNLRGSVTAWLTSWLFCLNSVALLLLNEQQFYLFGQIQTSQTGGQLYSNTYPYGECSLVREVNRQTTREKEWKEQSEEIEGTM